MIFFSATISCITGEAGAWDKDGEWTEETVKFGKTFADKPQVMIAARAAGKKSLVSNVVQNLSEEIVSYIDISVA